MTNRFDAFSNLGNNLGGLGSLESTMPNLTLPDKRSRAERKEDFEKEISALDKKAITELKDKLIGLTKDADGRQEDIWLLKNDLENSLIKFIRYIDEFEDLNSDESRKLSHKKKELKLDARHDWADKSRLFIFRVLASTLFICTLFIIGYVEREYDWATLPLSKYIKPLPNAPGK